MTIQKVSNYLIYGVAADTKPTTSPANTLFVEQDTGNIYRYTGAAWALLRGASKTETLTNKTMDSASNTFTGVGLLGSNNTWSGLNTFAVAAAGGFESVSKQTISGSTDFFTIDNAFSEVGVFSPIIRSDINSTNSANYHNAIYFQGKIKSSLDTGTEPIMIFGSRIDNSTGISNRPIVGFRNLNSDLMRIYPFWVDFMSSPIVNMSVKADVNALSGVAQDPIAKRTGIALPATLSASATATNIVTLVGSLANHVGTGAGTNTQTWDTTEGLIMNWASSTTANVMIGLVPPAGGVGITRRAFATRVRMRSKVDTVASSVSRLYFGFSSASTLPGSDTPLATTDHGVIVGFSSTDTTYQIYHNDGATSVTKDAVTGAIAKNTSYHTIEISWTAAGNITVTFDGTAQTISADLPATTTNLFFYAVAQNATAAARTHSVKGVWFETSG